MSTQGLDVEGPMPVPAEVSDNPVVASIQQVLRAVNAAIAVIASLALIAACVVLSHSVVVRYVLRAPTYWQDEAAVFLIVGATFLSAAGVQERRGHIGIEAIVGLLPDRINTLRLLAIDVFAALFCGFFSWKSWTLLREAWTDGQVTSSTWAPPLWIPYGLMTAGMALLTLQLLAQIAAALTSRRRA